MNGPKVPEVGQRWQNDETGRTVMIVDVDPALRPVQRTFHIRAGDVGGRSIRADDEWNVWFGGERLSFQSHTANEMNSWPPVGWTLLP